MKRKPIIVRNPVAKIVKSMSGTGAHGKTQKALRRSGVIALHREIGGDFPDTLKRSKTTGR